MGGLGEGRGEGGGGPSHLFSVGARGMGGRAGRDGLQGGGIVDLGGGIRDEG